MPKKTVQYRVASPFEPDGDSNPVVERRGAGNKFPGKTIMIAVLVVVLIILGVWIGRSFGKTDPNGNSAYSAVYLTTGDIYFGSFSRFPTPHITNAWHLDRGVDKNNQPQLGLSAMKDAVWAPANTLYLNAKEIVFWTRLRNDSPLIKSLSGQAQPAAVGGVESGSNAGTGTGTGTTANPDSSAESTSTP